MGVCGFIGVIYPQGLSPEVRQFPPGTLCLCQPTNAIFKLVTLCLLTIDVFETLGIYTHTQNLNHIQESGRSYSINFFLLPQQPPVYQDLLIHEVSRSHTTTHHSR